MAKEEWGDELSQVDITADSGNPAKLKEWCDMRYRVTAAKKGPGSLQYGVEYLAGHRIHIHSSRCLNFAREVRTFKRREDKDGNTLETFVEINDDTIAAARYATEWIWGQYHGRIADDYSASDLGL
jgi:phage terminase large subunit